jgi:sulfoxide reductase heme-binding subunit YedZ
LKGFALFRGVVFAAALVPAAALVYGFFTDDLTANPIDYITDTTGTSALTLLILSLTVTPLRRITGWNELIKLRRMLGLYAFFYACLHLLTWSVLDWFFDFASMGEDILERPFITIGMTTFLLLLPLAVTSTARMIRRLGKRWQRLHRLVYVAAVTAIIHFWWIVKADIREPRLWAFALSVLLGFRLWWAFRTRSLRAPGPAAGTHAPLSSR